MRIYRSKINLLYDLFDNLNVHILIKYLFVFTAQDTAPEAPPPAVQVVPVAPEVMQEVPEIQPQIPLEPNVLIVLGKKPEDSIEPVVPEVKPNASVPIIPETPELTANAPLAAEKNPEKPPVSPEIKPVAPELKPENPADAALAPEAKPEGTPEVAKDMICTLGPIEAGKLNLCQAAVRMYTYSAARGKCVTFKYGGCNGSKNLFHTRKACQKRCGGSKRGGSNLFFQDLVHNL